MQRLDVSAARSAFDQASKLSPPAQAEAKLHSAELSAKLGEHEEALLGFEELASLEPNQLGDHQAEALAGLGRARAKAGDAAGALQAYERALSVDPQNPVALQGQGEELLRAGKAGEAIAPLAKAIELVPSASDARRDLAEAHQKAGDPAAALRVLDPEAVALEDRPQILLKAAEIQTAQGDLAAAQVTLQSAVAISPDDPPLHSALAKVYADSGQAEAASKEQAQIALLTGVSLKATNAEQEAAEKAKTVANGFAGLAESFPVAGEDGTAYARVIFLGLGSKPTWVELAREWLMPRTLDVPKVEAALHQALDARFGLAELIPVSSPAEPALARLRSLSTERVDIAVVNEELAADATLAAWLSAPEPVTMHTPADAPLQVEVRMFAGHVSDEVQIRAGALRLEHPAQFVHWNVRVLPTYSLLLALLAFPFVRGWGRLVVKLDYQHRKEAKGFFSIVISRRPGRATSEKEKAGASKATTYQRKARAWSRFARHMVDRETLFRLIPARHYYVCVHGIMQDDRGEIVGNYLEERRVRIPRGKTVEVGFDFRPKEATLEVRLQRPPGDKAGVARVVLRGVAGSLKFVKDDVAIFYVGKGRHVVGVGFGDCAFEREVEVRELVAQQVTIGLGDPLQAVFQGVPEAIEPFLTGDLAQCARALDKAGMTQKANELRAKFHEQRGDKAEAAKFHKAAGNLTQAADLVADAADRTESAELYQEAGDFKRAAAAFSEAGDHAKAADAYERAFEFADAVDAYRNAGNTEKALELLERLGRHYEAGAAALQLGDADRAIRNFQQVDQRDPDYGESRRALSELFAAREEWTLALDKLKEAIEAAGEEAAPLELYEQQGNLLEKNGDLTEALQVFENIRKRDYQYPQVAERIRALRELLHAAETMQAPPATGASIPSAGAATQPTPNAGAPLQDRYEILGELGRGGMGVVFKARDRRLGRVVALKRLPDNLRDHPTAVALFLREAQAAAALNHANIVTLFDADQDDGNYYLTMEFLEGFPLDEILRKRGKLTVKDTLRLGLQIATGMQFAHERGIVHRDIKTSNLFFTREPRRQDHGLRPRQDGRGGAPRGHRDRRHALLHGAGAGGGRARRSPRRSVRLRRHALRDAHGRGALQGRRRDLSPSSLAAAGAARARARAARGARGARAAPDGQAARGPPADDRARSSLPWTGCCGTPTSAETRTATRQPRPDLVAFAALAGEGGDAGRGRGRAQPGGRDRGRRPGRELRRERRHRGRDPPALRARPRVRARELGRAVRRRARARGRGGRARAGAAALGGFESTLASPQLAEKYARVLRMIHAYRARGHRVADTDPLGSRVEYFPELDPAHYGLGKDDQERQFLAGDLPGGPIQRLSQIVERLRATYCRKVGVEFTHIQEPGRRQWLMRRMEESENTSALPPGEKLRVLEKLCAAELFERFLHTKFIGQKRFSLEGAESLIPLLDTVVEDAPSHGVREIVIGMAHRGRLNVLANILGKSLASIFSEFEDIEDAEAPFGSGDVKYHKGYSTDRTTRSGGRVHLSLTAQPVAPRGGGPGRRGPRAREAGARRRSQGPPPPAAPDPRRRRLRRPGHRRRDAEPLAPERLLDRRHGPRRREQPDRLHHDAPGGALDALLHRRREDDPGADLPRERRRPGGGRALRAARLRLPPALQRGRRDRPGLLPPPRPQRGRRAELHAAAPVREDPRAAGGARALHRGARARGRADARRSGAHRGGPEQAAAPGAGLDQDGAARARRAVRAARRRGRASRARRPAEAAETGVPIERLARIAEAHRVELPADFELHKKLEPLLERRAQGRSPRRRRSTGRWPRRSPSASLLRRGHAGAALRPGQRRAAPSASATRCSSTRRTGREYAPLDAPRRDPGALRGLRQPALRGRRARLRVRLLASPTRARSSLWEAQFGDFANGAQVDHRPVHRLGATTSGAA